ncbi:hypothetical protein CAOG_06189 [Capsaspora owczarzaki ATCC 30864]|uniref:Uncharacterized protein n=1 Tax=Capsaspora owczarzaki (strain ATCC 30864) TaxID=595528 RepID=A0A0D2UL06_CAPO3|nr:hypothetical protein CAOG_06189 [Capsaspora owczarzaki ATCC 30864]KJE95776.1 hypothetical protein CAOG_006189 [Capsaspora owczarzaki ATCC 30864]|eukprot:XP_004345779.1 hypothetical protein CAOG_06189 [Capsaspora owczarzaki ATCC 30864]
MNIYVNSPVCSAGPDPTSILAVSASHCPRLGGPAAAAAMVVGTLGRVTFLSFSATAGLTCALGGIYLTANPVYVMSRVFELRKRGIAAAAAAAAGQDDDDARVSESAKTIEANSTALGIQLVHAAGLSMTATGLILLHAVFSEGASNRVMWTTIWSLFPMASLLPVYMQLKQA